LPLVEKEMGPIGNVGRERLAGQAITEARC